MRFGVFFRNLALGAAATSFALAGAAWGESSATVGQPGSNAWQLAGATVQLDHTLDARNAQKGEHVEAKLNDKVTTANGVKLDRGTELLGTVDHVRAANGNGSSLSLAFTEARLKDGRMIPVKVTVIGAYPPSEAQMELNGDQTMPPAPRWVRSHRVDQEPGLLHHIAMTSAVRNHDSATFRTKSGDVKLPAGTFLEVGIASRNANAQGA